MKYIEQNLLQNEKLVYSVRPHWIIFSSSIWMMIFAILCWIYSPGILYTQIYNNWTAKDIIFTGLFCIGVYWFLGAFIYFKTSEYGVTNKRVVIKVGWIQRVSLELLLDKVEGVFVDQTIVGRILNYGGITVIGTGGTNDRFPYIPNPLLFRKITQQEIESFEENLRRPS